MMSVDILESLQQTHDKLMDLDFNRLGFVCLDAIDEIENLRAEIERKSEASLATLASQEHDERGSFCAFCRNWDGKHDTDCRNAEHGMKESKE
jgi:hypothetical protein